MGNTCDVAKKRRVHLQSIVAARVHLADDLCLESLKTLIGLSDREGATDPPNKNNHNNHKHKNGGRPRIVRLAISGDTMVGR